MQQSTLSTNNQSLLMMAAAIFVSVTAAVIVSTLVIMSLMRGEIASALSSTVQNAAPVTAQTTGTCAMPASEAATDSGTANAGSPGVSGNATYSAAPLTSSVHFAKYTPIASATHSFNNTTTNTLNTTNNVTNTELHSKVVVKDSFNDNSVLSHNPVVVKDNTVNVNSNNNSGNTTNTTTNTTTTTNTAVNTNTNTNTTTNTTTNLNSNNVTNVASNNTVEAHLLSDNVTVVIPTI